MVAQKKWGEIAVAACLALTGIGFAMLAARLPAASEPGTPGPGTVPFVLGIVLTICALLVIVRAFLSPAIDGGAEPDFSGFAKPVLGLLFLCACAWALEPLGFILATVIFLIAGFIVLGETPWRIALPAAAISALGLWLIFTKLLGVGLPYGLIENVLFQ